MLDKEASEAFVRDLAIPGADPEPGIEHCFGVVIAPQDIANVLVVSGRVAKFPKLGRRIHEFADADVVDRYQAEAAADRMLEHEPTLGSASPSSPAI